MGSFIPKSPGAVEKVVKSIILAGDKIDKVLESRMNTVVNIVYLTARARRPKISKQQQKAMGRSPKSYRVSDPNAIAGVPVDTGNLQISIKKEVKKAGKKLIGRIFVDGPGSHYAEYMEFGTTRIRPRSFMRAAMHVNRDTIKKKWEAPIE